MKRFLLLLLHILPTFTCLAQINYASKMDDFMQAQVSVNKFNGNVLVAQNGQILYQKAFGFANYDTKDPLTLNSLFDLASLSKQFTAISILLLRQQGKLSLSDSLRKFFPELPYTGITIRHLLTHTSGLPDYEQEMDEKWDHKRVAFNPDMIRFLADEKPKLLFKPGQRYTYSNTGYALLASIVEKVSGLSFARFTTENIFRPLTMSRSRVYNTRRTSPEVISDYAFGYVYSNKRNKYVLPDSTVDYNQVYYLDGIQGDGTINSTVGDLLKWDRALKNHTLLAEDAQREMLTGQVVSDSSAKSYYGYGVGIGQNDRGDVLRHTGSWPGYLTYLTRYVPDDLTIIVLSNNQSNPTTISQALANILFDKPVDLPQKKEPSLPIPKRTTPVGVNLLNDYVGVYEGPFARNPTATFTITRKGNQIFHQLMTGHKRAIYPETETKFFFDTLDADLEFIRDSSGKVMKQVMKFFGTYTVEAKKIK